MSEISFQYNGSPPEKFKELLFIAVKEGMKDIKQEVLANKGFVFLDYIGPEDIRLQAVSENPETTLKMTIKLQGLLSKKVGLN